MLIACEKTKKKDYGKLEKKKRIIGGFKLWSQEKTDLNMHHATSKIHLK